MQKFGVLYIFLISFILIKPISVKAEISYSPGINSIYKVSNEDTVKEDEEYIKKNIKTGEVTIGQMKSTKSNQQDSNDITYGKLPKVDYNKGNSNKSLYNLPIDGIFSPYVLGIIGSNDRRVPVADTTVYPYSTIAYIEIEFPNSSMYVGTAWIFGESTAMTAGHCVYDEDNGGWAKSIKIYPGIYYDGEEVIKPFGYYEASVLHSSKNYIDSGNAYYDWGLLEFDENISQYTGSLGYTNLTENIIGRDVTITGYPGEKYYAMYTMDGNIIYSDEHELYYKIDTTGGQSGSPVYLSDEDEDRNVAVGIHTRFAGDYNLGTKINASLYNYMKQFK